MWHILVQAFKGWQEDKISVWSAALSYYSVFSLAPLFLLLISVAGFFFGKQAVEGEVSKQLSDILGSTGAHFIEETLQNSSKTSDNIFSTIISVIILIFGASGVFGQLKQTLNAIWGVTTKKSLGIKAMFFDRAISLSMLLVIAFLLLISLAATTLISLAQSFFSASLPFPGGAIEVINALISFSIISILFALIYKILPDIKIRWKYVLTGGVVTSLLFTIGKTILGIYMGSSGVTSTYGAAASLIIILLWIYYTSQIVFFGAEITKYVSLYYEKEIIPSHFGEIADSTLDKHVTKAAKMKKQKPTVAEKNVPAYVSVVQIIILGIFYLMSRNKR